MRVRVRAQWGNAATGVFTAALAVLLIAGIVRTARRGRKDTRMRPANATRRRGRVRRRRVIDRGQCLA